jgi:protein phosphatase
LDYLHDNGISFDGRIEDAYLGIANEQAVWTNFIRCNHSLSGVVLERAPDTRALSERIYEWIAGKAYPEGDQAIPRGLRSVFQRAFSEPGFANGRELAEALESSIEEASSSQSVDFQLGRRTSLGMVRTLNEDSLLTMEMNCIRESVSRPVGVYVVADGMGGHEAGEVASGTIVNTIAGKAIRDLFPGKVRGEGGKERMEWLKEAVGDANRAVYDLRKSRNSDMGSTLVSALVEGNQAYLAHVGDSRAYLINARGISQLTTDHSLVERLISSNQITRAEARYHPQRNVIYRTIGDKPKVEIETSNHTLRPGDHLLLCSDGLSGMVDDKSIFKIVMGASSPQKACDALVEAANAAGGDDNISVIIVKVVPA